MYIYYISAFVHHFRTFKFRGENLDGQVFQLLHNCCMDLRLPGNKSAILFENYRTCILENKTWTILWINKNQEYLKLSASQSFSPHPRTPPSWIHQMQLSYKQCIAVFTFLQQWSTTSSTEMTKFKSVRSWRLTLIPIETVQSICASSSTKALI